MKRLRRAIEVCAWTAFFAAAALVLALRFWFLPDIERYREDIVAAVSRTIGQPVKIGGIEAGWLGWSPRVSFTDVRILDAQGREALVLPAVENVIAWRSLLARELKLVSLAIEAPRLDVRRDAAGVLHVAGMRVKRGAGEGRLADWILSQDEIVIRNAEIEWHDEKRAAPPLALSALNLRLRNSGREHAVGLSARPPAALGSTLELRAELAGESLSDPAAWNGRVFAELGYTDLAGWRAWVDYPLDVREGQGALRLWLTLENGVPAQVIADVALERVAAQLDPGLERLALESLSGRIQASASRGGGYALAGHNLALVAAQGPAMAPTDFRLQWRPAAGAAAERGKFDARLLELEPLARLAHALPLPAQVRERMAALDPRGRLQEASLEWSGPLAAPQKISGKAKFSGLGAKAAEGSPGFSGLSGSIEGSEAGGNLTIAARQAALSLPRLLPGPQLEFDLLDAALGWERSAQGALGLRLTSLAFANADLEGRLSGSYAPPGRVDLTAELKRGDAAHVARYLPHPEIIGPALRAYVARAVVAGQASEVHLRLKGDLADFPFTDPAKGEFRVSARVEKGVLDYVEGWPRIQDIDAQLLFERDRMEIIGRSASVLGARLADVRVGIESFKAPKVRLRVAGQADGALEEFAAFVAQSPLQGKLGAVASIAGAGKGRLALKLDVPLAQPSASGIEGSFSFSSSRLSVHSQLPPLERASGRASFTQEGLASLEGRGRLFGGAVAVSGGSRGAAGVEIVAKGDATVAGLQPLLDHPLARHVAGTAPYTATIAVHEGRTRVIVESSLRGLVSALPAPLGKGAADALPLRVELQPSEAGARERITIALGSLAHAEVLRRREGKAMVVQRAAIALSPGSEPVRVPERPGVLVYGSLPALDADRWLAFLKAGEGRGEAVAGAAAPSAAVPAAAPGPVTSVDVKLGALDLFGKRVHDLALRAGIDSGGWSAAVQAEELAGDLSYRGEKGGLLVARLTHLRVPESYPGAPVAESKGAQSRELPAMDVVAERFTYRGKELGRVEVVAAREGVDWRIDKLSVVNPDAALSGRGLWHPGADATTVLTLELDAASAGRLLARLGYRDLVRRASARLRGTLRWAGDPLALDYPTLSGELELDAEKGQFLEIEPGLGKLISLMSLQALPRRLSLDFRDVFSKGFQFDRIEAKARIERGVMTVEDFDMRGSAAQVEMKGVVDLVKETQNMTVRVVPSLGDTASTALVLINPLLYFPAAIAQRILKDPLGHIFAFNYTVTGTWDDPKVAKVGVAAQPATEAENR